MLFFRLYCNGSFNENDEQKQKQILMIKEDDDDNALMAMIYEEPLQQHIEQEAELLTSVSNYTLERVLGGYLAGTRFIYDEKYEIAIGCLTTSIGLAPLPYLYRLRAIAFLNHGLCSKCLNDCDYYCTYHILKGDDDHERYLMDGLLIRAHANVLLTNYKAAHEDLERLMNITSKYQSSFQQAERELRLEESNENILNDEEDGDELSIIDALNTLCELSERILTISEIQEKKRSESKREEFQTLVQKLCMYCEEYEKMIVHFELELIELHHGELLQTINLDMPLSIEDIVTLAQSQDINARSMGAVLLSDKFDELSQTTNTDDQSILIKSLDESRCIEAIIDSIMNWKDTELRFFATKALSDLGWSATTELRWRIINSKVLIELISQLRSEDPDLIGVSVSAIALLGRGGTGIDRIIREQGGLDALSSLLANCTENDKNLGYIMQAFTWLSGDIDNKIYIAHDKYTIPIMYNIAKSNKNSVARKFSIVALGNILQNPEIWGRPENYENINTIVKKLVEDGIIDVLMKYAMIESYNDDYSTVSIETMELQVNSLNTLTHLLGFKIVRDKLESMGGERLFYDLLYTSTSSVLSDILSKAIRFYRTLQDYGDHMADVLLPRYRLTLQTNNEIESAHSSISTVLKNTLESQNTGLFGIGNPPISVSQQQQQQLLHQQQHEDASNTEQALTNELLKILDMKIMKDHKHEATTSGNNKAIATKQQQPTSADASSETLSKLVNNLFDVASYVWNGDEKTTKHQKNRKKKNKKKSSKQKKHEQNKSTVSPAVQPQEKQSETQANQTPADNVNIIESTVIEDLSEKQSNRVVEVESDNQLQQQQQQEQKPDPYTTFLREFEHGMNDLAIAFNWGIFEQDLVLLQ
jgi:hypothetical protein